LEPPLARGTTRFGRPAPPAHDERRADLLRQTFQRQLAIARLAARLLGDGGDQRPDALEQPRALRLLEGGRRPYVEDRFDPRSGDVGVLAPGPGGTARPQLDLCQRDRQPLVDLQLVGYAATVASA
jgi:hypothetical protein